MQKSNEKFRVRVSKEAFIDKPSAQQHIKAMKKGFNTLDTDLTVQEIAEKWVAGHSITPVKLSGKEATNANWIGQQIFAVDFDNENGDKDRVNDDYYVTPQEALEMANQNGLEPAFIYSTFSSSERHEKFRMIFVMEKAVTSKQLHAEIMAKLFSVFMKDGYIVVDTKCKDLCRSYYGGKQLLYSDYDARTEIANVVTLDFAEVPGIIKLRSKHNSDGVRLSDYNPLSQMHSSKVKGCTTEAMTAIINNDPHKLREDLQNRLDSTDILLSNIRTVQSNMNPYHIIKSLPLHSILNVSLSTPFRCIMRGHEDKHPSAYVRQLDNGFFAYYCYTCYGGGKGQSLIDIIIEATSCKAHEAIAFVEEVLNIKLQTEHQLECRKLCIDILSFTQSEAFRSGKWEPLYRHMHQRKTLSHYRYYIEQALLYVPPEPIEGHGIPTFFQSIRETSEYMNLPPHTLYCTGKDKTSISKKRNELADIGLIRKCSSIDHPSFAKSREYKERTGNRYHKEFISILKLNEETLSFALEQIYRAKMNGERANYKTRASIMVSRGQYAADRIFTQDSGMRMPKYQQDFITYMLQTVSLLTAAKGWTTEDEIINEIKQTSMFSGITWKVRQFRSLLTDGTQYVMKRVTNELKTSLNLPRTLPLRKIIIVAVNPASCNDNEEIERSIVDISSISRR